MRYISLLEGMSSVPSTHVGQLTGACSSSFKRSDALGLLGYLQSFVHAPIYITKTKIN